MEHVNYSLYKVKFLTDQGKGYLEMSSSMGNFVLKYLIAQTSLRGQNLILADILDTEAGSENPGVGEELFPKKNLEGVVA